MGNKNNRKSNRIITEKRTLNTPEGDKFQDILKRNNIDINDPEQLETYMRSRGFSDSSIRKSLRGARQYAAKRGERNFYFDNKDGGFRIFNEDGSGEITKENRKSGNRQGFGLGDLVGLGNDVSSFAGVVKDLKMRELKIEQKGIGELSKVKSKGRIEALTAPETLVTPEVKLGSRDKGGGVSQGNRGSRKNQGNREDFNKEGVNNDADSMLLAKKERAQRSFDEQVELNYQAEALASVPNRLIPLKGSDPFDLENPRGGPVNNKNDFGVVSTTQKEFDMNTATVEEMEEELRRRRDVERKEAITRRNSYKQAQRLKRATAEFNRGSIRSKLKDLGQGLRFTN